VKRTERLYALTEYLRRRRTAVTVAELAEHFGVTPRTVHRDLALLREQAVPIQGEPGRGGGLQLAASYSMPPLGLSVDEAVALWLSFRLGALLGPLPAGGRLAPAVDKVLGALPPEKRRQVNELLGRIVVGKLPRAGLVMEAGRLAPEVFRTCEQAFLRGCRVRIAYVDRLGQRTERSVAPHGLLVQAPLWYLLAEDPERGGAPRYFRLDRIQGAQLEPQLRFNPRDPRQLFAELQGLELPAQQAVD
jgi:predicted DNA-binding transcriptional regulator YafY